MFNISEITFSGKYILFILGRRLYHLEITHNAEISWNKELEISIRARKKRLSGSLNWTLILCLQKLQQETMTSSKVQYLNYSTTNPGEQWPVHPMLHTQTPRTVVSSVRTYWIKKWKANKRKTFVFTVFSKAQRISSWTDAWRRHQNFSNVSEVMLITESISTLLCGESFLFELPSYL